MKATVSGVVSGVTSVVRLEPFRGALDSRIRRRVVDHASHLAYIADECAPVIQRLMRCRRCLAASCSAAHLAWNMSMSVGSMLPTDNAVQTACMHRKPTLVLDSYAAKQFFCSVCDATVGSRSVGLTQRCHRGRRTSRSRYSSVCGTSAHGAAPCGGGRAAAGGPNFLRS